MEALKQKYRFFRTFITGKFLTRRSWIEALGAISCLYYDSFSGTYSTAETLSDTSNYNYGAAHTRSCHHMGSKVYCMVADAINARTGQTSQATMVSPKLILTLDNSWAFMSAQSALTISIPISYNSELAELCIKPPPRYNIPSTSGATDRSENRPRIAAIISVRISWFEFLCNRSDIQS